MVKTLWSVDVEDVEARLHGDSLLAVIDDDDEQGVCDDTTTGIMRLSRFLEDLGVRLRVKGLPDWTETAGTCASSVCFGVFTSAVSLSSKGERMLSVFGIPDPILGKFGWLFVIRQRFRYSVFKASASHKWNQVSKTYMKSPHFKNLAWNNPALSPLFTWKGV